MSLMKRALIPIVIVGALCVGTVGCSSSSDSSSGGAFCDKAKSADLENIDDDSPEFVDALKDLEKSAPSAIKDDMKLLTDALVKIQDLDTSDPEAMLDALEDFDQDKLEKASENIQAYLKDECGIDAS